MEGGAEETEQAMSCELLKLWDGYRRTHYMVLYVLFILFYLFKSDMSHNESFFNLFKSV